MLLSSLDGVGMMKEQRDLQHLGDIQHAKSSFVGFEWNGAAHYYDNET